MRVLIWMISQSYSWHNLERGRVFAVCYFEGDFLNRDCGQNSYSVRLRILA